VSPLVFFMTRIRTWRDFRPITEQIGGRSFAYVPRPRRLFALRRGGSSRSPCHSPFFPSVLEHFVGFDFQIAQGFCCLLCSGVGLQQMSHFQRRCPADLQFSSQFRRRFSLQHFSQKQYRFLRCKMPALKYRAAVQVVNAATRFATIYIQVASFRSPKPVRLFCACLAMWAFQPGWMKIPIQPFNTCFSIH